MAFDAAGSQRVIVTLGDDAPPFLVAALRHLDGVTVVDGGPETTVIRQGEAKVLRLSTVSSDDVIRSLDGGDPKLGVRDLVAVHGFLDEPSAAQLEDRGVSFGDVAGRAWISGRPRTAQARSRDAPKAGRSMRAEAVRLAQLVADYPGRSWTQRELASKGDSTQTTAQRLLIQLEQAGLMMRDGAGRGSERRVTDSRELRHWLLKRVGPGRAVRLPFYVRDVASLPEQVENVRLALTGGAAASRLDVPVTTADPIPAFRADCGPERLEELPSLLGGFRTESGPTAILIADPKRLAHVDARRLHDGRLVAPPSRVMLDLTLERRGVAAAELFADLWRDRDYW